MVLGALERELAAEMNKLVLQWHCNAAQLDFGDDTRFEFHMLKAEDTFNEIGKHYLPWYSQWSNTEAQRLAQMYRAFLEEEKEPGFEKWHKDVQDKMMAEVREAQQVVKQLEEVRVRRALHDKEQAERQARRHTRARLR